MLKLNISDESLIIRKVKSLLLRLYTILDNSNNANITQNGEEKFLDTLLSNFKGKSMTAFDIGANIGEYSLLLLNKAQSLNIQLQLHSFEPGKDAFKSLESKTKSFHNITINNFGASDKTEEKTLFFNKDKTSLASIYPRDLSHYNISLSHSDTISLVRLDEYIDSKAIQTIDFVKIDVEGHELSVFKGLGKYIEEGVIKVIQFEYGGANIDSRTFLRDFDVFFQKNSYRLFKLKKDSLEAFKYTPSKENFFNSNFIAIHSSII